MKAADPSPPEPLGVLIRPLRDSEEARACAAIMAQSEPWITLRRDFEHCFNLLNDRTLEIYVAHVGEDLAGCVGVNMHGAFVGYIRALVVAPERRSRGIGAQLMRFAEDRIFRESPNVFLCVSGFNPRAQRFYQRLGYERVGELKHYVVADQSEILMRKSIGPKVGFQPRG
jgi:ribosomal-protein-alanine N-acetyltransferase